MNTAQWINDARKILVWSQADLANKMLVSQAHISQWELGRNGSSPRQIKTQKNILNIATSESFDEKKKDFLDTYKVSGKASVASPSISAVTHSISNSCHNSNPTSGSRPSNP